MEYLKILDSHCEAWAKSDYTIVFASSGGMGYTHQEDDNVM